MSSAQIYTPQQEENKSAAPTTMQAVLMIGFFIALWVGWKYFAYKFYSANPKLAALSAAF